MKHNCNSFVKLPRITCGQVIQPEPFLSFFRSLYFFFSRVHFVGNWIKYSWWKCGLISAISTVVSISFMSNSVLRELKLCTHWVRVLFNLSQKKRNHSDHESALFFVFLFRFVNCNHVSMNRWFLWWLSLNQIFHLNLILRMIELKLLFIFFSLSFTTHALIIHLFLIISNSLYISSSAVFSTTTNFNHYRSSALPRTMVMVILFFFFSFLQQIIFRFKHKFFLYIVTKSSTGSEKRKNAKRYNHSDRMNELWNILRFKHIRTSTLIHIDV